MRGRRSAAARCVGAGWVAVGWLGLAAVLGACGEDVSAKVESLQRQGRFAESLEPLREGLAEKPADPELNLLYGLALLQTGQAGGAVWPLGRAAEEPEYAVRAGLLLATALLQGGSATDAIAAADRVIALEPDNLDARVLHARGQVDAVHNEQALEELDALIEENPDDSRLVALRLVPLIRMQRLDEAAEGLAQLRALVGSDELQDPAVEAHFCAAEATFLFERKEKDEAQKAWETCLESHPGNDTVLRGALEFYRQTGQTQAARKLLSESLEASPGNTEIRIALAELLRATGHDDEGRRLMEEGAEEFPSPERWSALADYHIAGEDFKAARAAIERAIEMLPSMPEELRFAYADVLILAGDPDAAEPIVESLELPVQRDLLRGRIQLVRGNPRGAFESFEKGIRLWPNNGAARFLAGQAAEQLGDFPEAVSQYREAVRVDPASSDAALALVALQKALGTPNLAIEPMRIHLSAQPNDIPARRVWVPLLFGSGDVKGARAALAQLRLVDAPAAVVVTATLRGEREGPAAAAAALAAAPLDRTQLENVEVLGALVDAWIEAGSPERALEPVDAALAAHPEAAVLYELRGRVLRASGDGPAAQAAFEHALELDPERASSLEGLARQAESRGDTAEALGLYERACAADPEAAAPAFAAAELIAARGDTAQAIERLESVVRIAPLHVDAARRLAELLSDPVVDLDRALDFARRAATLGRTGADLERWGRLEVAKGDGPAAVKTLRDALAKEPGRASTQYWLGRALVLTGDEDSARAAYRDALKGGAQADAERAQAELARLGEGDAS